MIASELYLPSGAYAVSPPVCVTLQYPTARTWVEDVKGFGGVVVGVYYAGSRPVGGPVGLLTAPQGAAVDPAGERMRATVTALDARCTWENTPKTAASTASPKPPEGAQCETPPRRREG